MTKLSDYVHTASAAEHLGVAQNNIRKWAACGDVPMRRNPVKVHCFFATSCDRLQWCSLQVLGRSV